MKRRIALGTAVTLGALVLATSIHAFAADISSDRAKEIALEHAKTKESDLVFSKVEQDYDDRRLVYEVELVTSGGTEYDYEIEAATGNIIAYDHDAEYYVPAGKEAGVSGTASGSGQISEAEAKKIALDRAGIAESQASHLSVRQERDDGRTVYEGKFFYNGMEYEFEIDAQTGTILEWDAESIYD